MLAVLQVDDAHDAAAAHQGHREKRFVAVFRQLVEKLEAGVMGSFLGDGHRFAMLRNPSGNALPDAEFQAVDHVLVRVLGGAKDQFVAFQNINEAGVALHQSRGEFDDAAQNFVKSVCGTEPNTDFVQYIYM